MARLDRIDRPVVELRHFGDEAAVYAARARRLGLSFVPSVELGAGARADLAAIRRGSFAMATEGERLAYLAPDEDAVPVVLHWLRCHPTARPRLRVSTPTAIRAALVEAGKPGLAARAVERLAAERPDLSARKVASGRQMTVGVALALAVGVSLVLDPTATLIAVNLIAASFFFGVSALRFVAAGMARTRAAAPLAPNLPDEALPIYTVLVPLYREAPLVGDLIAALDALDWPRDRLDVKLLLEADDRQTIAAVRRAVRGAPYEIVMIPPAGPRTKPKALAFALALARGEFVTVYDAEDRPHPQQLREAFAAFARAGKDVACLQSPLVIDNGDASWLALLFTVEYAALFDGLLPALAALGMPLPLGGTSNHLRRAALEAVGGWDPFNMTEDADLGIRLARFGYRSGALSLPTLEDAPAALDPWFRQRTRWFKGWMQTWLVHTRHPVRLARELGPKGLLGFNLVATGLIVSSMIYPVYLASLVAFAANPLGLWGDGGMFAAMMLGVNLFNLVAGYLAMAILGSRSLGRRGRVGEARGLLYLPFYWLLMSLASYRAVFELIVRPHHWEKTPHQRRARGPAPTPRSD